MSKRKSSAPSTATGAAADGTAPAAAAAEDDAAAAAGVADSSSEAGHRPLKKSRRAAAAAASSHEPPAGNDGGAGSVGNAASGGVGRGATAAAAAPAPVVRPAAAAAAAGPAAAIPAPVVGGHVAPPTNIEDAALLRNLLVRAARERRSLTYSEILGQLGHSFSRPKMRALCTTLGRVDRAGAARGEPGLAVLVVRQSDKLPGAGWWDRARLDRLPDGATWEGSHGRDIVAEEQKITFDYWVPAQQGAPAAAVGAAAAAANGAAVHDARSDARQ